MNMMTAAGTLILTNEGVILHRSEKITRKPRVVSADEMASSLRCPRCENDVYALAGKLQYYIGSVYLELANKNRWSTKMEYTSLALRQMDLRDEIVALANARLDPLLRFFYNNGGPVIELPVTAETAEELKPLFDSILINFFDQMDDIVYMTPGMMRVANVERRINENVVDTYLNLRTLFQSDELKSAFDDLIRLRYVNTSPPRDMANEPA